ncbi:MAG: ATP-binding cassette domain-containing protein [Olsenella sp.]|nr:ATP-binding cassette domain-containing protein [Olsenella sp.]
MQTRPANVPNTRDVLASLRHVTLRYERGVVALDDVSLDVRSGERVCVLGANGSGKSTLASVICGLLAPDEGDVRLLGEKVLSGGVVDFGAYRRARRGLGLVFQNPDDQIVTTVVEDDVAFGPENLGIPAEEIGARVERELSRVAMGAYAKADPTRLSGGQKQRVAIAGALAMEPRLLVLDEPGALLDVRGRRSIMRVMGRLRDGGTTIVHITHFMEEALEADRLVVMSAGRIVLEGTPAEIFSHGAELEALGLEEPFCARLSEGLRARGVNVGWTCDDSALAQELVSLLAGGDGTVHRGGADGSASDGVPARGATRDSATPGATRDPATPAVEADSVSYSYDGAGNPAGRRALDGVSFSVAPGTSVAIVGQTGSGKSTLLRIICALETPDAGHMRIDGLDTLDRRNRRRLFGQHIGYVMQHPERQLFAETVMQDVSFGPTNMGLAREEVERRCTHALSLVGLADKAEASPFELSGGQQRLCAIAGILAMHPDTLVLDEPNAGLDPRGRAHLRSILADIHAHGVTIVRVTHSMNEAARAEHVIVLDQSHVMMQGAPREVFRAENNDVLRDAGLGLPHALAWARILAEKGAPDLGTPLSLDELADAIAALAARPDSSAADQPASRPGAGPNDPATESPRATGSDVSLDDAATREAR